MKNLQLNILGSDCVLHIFVTPPMQYTGTCPRTDMNKIPENETISSIPYVFRLLRRAVNILFFLILYNIPYYELPKPYG